MKKIAYIIFVLAVMPFLLISCGDDAPVKQGAIKKPVATPAPKAKKEVKAEAKKAEGKLAREVIHRNPFKTFIVEYVPKDDGRPKGPLECCDLNVFRIQAVVTGIPKPRALVLAPDGKKYTVSVGDQMGIRDGVIVSIRRSGLVIKEKLRDADGVVVDTQVVELNLPSLDDDKSKTK